MGNPQLRVVIENGVATVILARPPVNALELTLFREFDACFEKLLVDEAIAAVVLTGEGRCFSSGLDLKQVPMYSLEQQRELINLGNRSLARLYAFPRPLVAAVNGHALAGGLVLALACDYRIGPAAPCKLGLAEVRVGIPFPAVAMEVVRAELAPDVARVWGLGGESATSEQALVQGVLDELIAPERVLLRAREIAAERAAFPRRGYAAIKHQLRAAALQRIEAIVENDADPLLAKGLIDGVRATG